VFVTLGGGWDSWYCLIGRHGSLVLPQNGGGKGWAWDEDSGSKVMPDSWVSLLDWLLCGPDREPKLQKEWAVLNGLHGDSIRRIKRDARFIKEWDRRAAELNISPERTQSVVDALHAQAVSGNTQAASLYLQFIDKFTPTRKVVVDETAVEGMSNGELAEALEAEVAHLRVVND
jgi:hypothetical protein